MEQTNGTISHRNEDVDVRSRLFALADEKYQRFSASLLPNINNILGVRIPEIRKIAKQIAKGDWRNYLLTADQEYFEEVMLQGMVIGIVKVDVDERLELIRSFVPKIDNWSVCDSFCSGLKFTKQHYEKVWEFIQPYAMSEREYEVRFAVVMLLDYFVNESYVDRTLALLHRVRHQAYYVQMAVAWAISICFVHFPQQTMVYLQESMLDTFTYNKALQKITESLRVDTATKQMIKGMKR